MIDQQLKNRLTIVGIFALSVIPLLLAWMLGKSVSQLSGTMNKGQLIAPVITADYADFKGFDEFSIKYIRELKSHWLIANVITAKPCSAVCLDALIKTKQLRLMLNKELSRTRRVVLMFEEIPADEARQLWLKESVLNYLSKQDANLYKTLLQPQNVLPTEVLAKLQAESPQSPVGFGNTDLLRICLSESLKNRLLNLRNGKIPEGMLFLIDPLGNVMMQYEPGFDPYKVKSDLMHLLKISQIG